MSIYHLFLVIVSFGVSRIQTQATLDHNGNSSLISGDPFVEDNEVEYHYPNVLSVKFHLFHSRVPKLLTKISLLEMECPIKQCNISLIDTVEAIQLESYESSDIANAIGKMNITERDAYNIFLIYNLNASSIERLLTMAGITFSEIYKRFVDSLQDPPNAIPKILGIVNVSVLNFMNAQAYGNDSTRLEVLATGNYSFENIQSVLQAVNKTAIDLLEAIPLNTIARNLRNFDSSAFRNFIKNLGVTSSNLLDFYNFLNVTSINFIAYPGYTQILSNFESYLNPEEVLATVTNKTTLVTCSKAKSLIKFQTENTDFVRNYSYFQAENIENPLTHYHIKNILLSSNEYKADDIAFIEVFNAYKGNISKLAVSYNTTRYFNCTYVTKLPYGEVHIENFPIVDNIKGHFITLSKTNSTIYNLGSPLFCQDELIAMATQDGANEIRFTTFMKKTSGISKPPGQQSTPLPGNVTTPSSVTVSKPGSGLRNFANIAFVSFLLTSVIVLFS